MEAYDHYLLDFIDTDSGIAINTPNGINLQHLSTLSVNIGGGQLISVETAMGVSRANLRWGVEKYCVPEGSLIELACQGEELFYFEIPRRPIPGITLAQPQDNPPY